MKKTGWLVGLVLAGAGVCLGQWAGPTSLPADPTAQSAEGKIVQEMFGKRIADAAKGRLKEEDALAVTSQLLAAASDGSTSGKLKAALATSALRVSVMIGSEPAGRLARKAMEMIQSVSPMNAVDKAFYLKEIAARRLGKAHLEHVSADELQALAKAAIEMSMSYVDVAMSDDDSGLEVSSTVRQARAWMNLYRLREYTQSMDDLDKQVKASTLKRVRLKEALARLETAKKSKDAEAIKLASRAVAGVYLETAGDLHAAAKYYGAGEDPRGKVVVAAVDVLDHPKPLDTRKALDAIDGLVRVIDSLTDVAKINASKSALELADLYLASDPPETAAAKVKLAMLEWQSASGTSQGEKVKKALSEAYGTIQAKLDSLGSGRVRLTYEFKSQAEINDWDTMGGTWEVGNSMLGCKTSGATKTGAIECRLPFRQDKPFKITITGAARHELTAKIVVTPWKSARWREPTLSFKVMDDGLYCYSFERDWTDFKTRLMSDKPCKIELSSTGDGNIAWSINGTEAYTFKPSGENVEDFKGSLKLVLQTKGSDRSPTLFDTVVIEGTILPNPDYVPDEYKKSGKSGEKPPADQN
jgi:hypothetical protein